MPSNVSDAHDREFVLALRKGLDVLTCFGRTHSRLTLSEVAELIGTSPASARRSLLTLASLGYVDTDGKRFWMAPRALIIAHAFVTSTPLASLAQALLDGLAERTRESASLGHLLEGDALILARATARRSLSTGLGIGARLPAHASALGRVLLASLDRCEMVLRVSAMPLRKLTDHTPTTVDQVVAIIDRCRVEGHAESDNEVEIGVRSMAVPVWDDTGRTVAAMSIAVRAERMSLQAFRDALLPELVNARDRLIGKLYPGRNTRSAGATGK